MRIIVCGGGHVGSGIVEYLATDNVDVIVIDNDAHNLARLNDMVDVQTILGQCSHPDVLEAAGAQDADLLIAVTSSDEVNIVTCQVAHTLFQVPLKIAHLRQASYLSPGAAALFGPDKIPLDVVISPEKEVAQAIHHALEVPGAIELMRFSATAYVVCAPCLPHSPLVSTPISHIAALFPTLEISVLCLIRGERLVVPALQEVFQPHDVVYFCIHKKDVHLAMMAFGHEETPLGSVLILGGGMVATPPRPGRPPTPCRAAQQAGVEGTSRRRGGDE